MTQRRATHESRTSDGRPSRTRRPRINTGKLAVGSHCTRPVKRLSTQKAPQRTHRKVTANGKHAAQWRAARKVLRSAQGEWHRAAQPRAPRKVLPAGSHWTCWRMRVQKAQQHQPQNGGLSRHRARRTPSNGKHRSHKSESTVSGGRDSQTRTNAARQHRPPNRKALRVRNGVNKPATGVPLHTRLT